MEIPLGDILKFDKNKYEVCVAMMKYAKKIEEIPELLMGYSEQDRDKRVAIIIKDIITGTVKYKKGV